MGKQSFIGEILHANGVRVRVTGSGNLITYLRSLDAINNQQLLPLVMSAKTNREPTILANFIDQRIQFEFRTTEYDERFNLSKIIVFIRPVASGYPQ